MQTLDIQTTVGDLVKERPARSRIFEKYQIDYCCGGKIPLAEACEKRGVDPETVFAAILADDETQGGYIDADAMGLSELTDHIVAAHHDHLREELPRLDFMTRKVAAVHGEGEPRLLQIREVYTAFQEELLHHMEKEERILFPMIRAIDGAKSAPNFHSGSLAEPIRVMESEHESTGDGLARFRELTDDYTPPEWACNTFRAMYHGLAELEQNMHQHVHKENNVLFPKAIEREAQLN